MSGPTKVVIPEQRFLSCRECDFYNYTMLKSGLSPIYGHFCSNPDIPEDKKRLSPLNWNGNLMDDKTPEWCPFLIKKIEEDRKPLRYCQAHKDGDCTHPDCPQLRDNEPYKSGRSCPLPDYDEDDDIEIPICNHCRTNEFVTVLPDGNKHCNKCGSNWI